MYSNVPERGSLASIQQHWQTHELSAAPDDRALTLALHHPIYSFDDHHSRWPRMADAVQHAINDSPRAECDSDGSHHNYQRTERQLVKGHKTPFIVAGHGGYYHLHNLNKDIGPGAVDADTKAHLIAANARQHGYVTITITANCIKGEMATIESRTAAAAPRADVFEHSSEAIRLDKPHRSPPLSS